MVELPTQHLEKLKAAIRNDKCSPDDVKLMEEAKDHYQHWVERMGKLTSRGRTRIDEMVDLLNEYKNTLEVDLVAKRGSAFLKRQKGQLKLDNSVLEEFLPHMLRNEIIEKLDHDNFLTGPQKAFMSLSFMPRGFGDLGRRPEVMVKVKDQDFTIATPIHYRFSASEEFSADVTATGTFALAVLATEIKLNLDKTMFQEAAGTAQRLKQGCPVAKYFLLVEYLDMVPEDTRLTEIDNVYLLRKVKRLPAPLRANIDRLETQHLDHPILSEVMWAYVQQIQSFIDAAWFDPDEALKRGAFI